MTNDELAAAADAAGRAVAAQKAVNQVIPPAPVEFTPEELAADPILRFFHYAHLPPVLRARSEPFQALAQMLVRGTPRNAERTVALRKLLEAKDCAIRAALP